MPTEGDESIVDLKDKAIAIQNSSDEMLGTQDIKEVENRQGRKDRLSFECDLCLKHDNHNFAEKYCFVCETNLCQDCHKNHVILKATRDHKISNIDGLFVQTRRCESGKHSFKARNANYFCKDCENFLCSVCRYEHAQMKFAKHHLFVSAKEQIRKYTSTKRYCGICVNNSDTNEAEALCLDCTPQMLLCPECVKEHAVSRKTRGHSIEHSQTKYHRADFTISNVKSSGSDMREDAEKHQDDLIGKSISGEKHQLLQQPNTSKFEKIKESILVNTFTSTLSIDGDGSKEINDQQQKVVKHHAINLDKEQNRQEANTKECCGICEENRENNEAVAICLDCNPQKILCSECVEEHALTKMTRRHRIEYSLANYREADVTISKDISSEPKTREDSEKPKDDVPGKPTLDDVAQADTIQLRWKPPSMLYEDHQYQIRYKTTSPSDKWKFYHENFQESTVVLEKLKSDSTFIFQVRMVNNDKEGPYSSQSDPICTKQSAAIRLKGFSAHLESSGVLSKSKLLLEENEQARNEMSKTRQLYLGSPNKIKCKEKTIMLVGATGSGKSTLVDGFINYILGVNWDDPFRFTLVDLEEDEINRNQAVSQTQWITTYCINTADGSRLDYKLNIIDTPGFGDTRGLERDKEIVAQIRDLFSASDLTGVVYLDAVCFITKAPDARLTPTQNYIFNSILSLFGRDIADNIMILITFADGELPPVIAALEKAKLPHKIFFPFNNSGLFSDNCGPDISTFSPMFWEMGCNSFKHFFDHLKTMQTKSLKQTKQVLSKRHEMEMTIENLMPLVKASLHKLDELKCEINIIEQHKTDIEANIDFKYTVTETHQIKKDLPKGQHVTNCLNCHFTCHQDCGIPRDEDKAGCWAMDGNGNCRQCPEKCHWKQHANTPYIFDYESVQVEKKYSEKEEKYRKAEGDKLTHENVVKCMMDEIIALQSDILDGMNVVTECNNVLKEIALRPNPLNVKEYIDLLIESEKQEKREGFQRRIECLMECRGKCMLEDDVQRLQTGYASTMSHATFKAENIEQKKKSFLGKIVSFLGRRIFTIHVPRLDTDNSPLGQFPTGQFPTRTISHIDS